MEFLEKTIQAIFTFLKSNGGEIIIALLGVILSIILAIVTSKLTLRQEVKKRIYERREQVYIKCFDLLQEVKDNPYLVFNNKEFFIQIKGLRTELKLFASNDVIEIIEPFYEKAKKTIEEYWVLFDGEEYETQKNARMEHDNLTELDFKQEEENYMRSHFIDKVFVETTITSLVLAMRKDMGTR